MDLHNYYQRNVHFFFNTEVEVNTHSTYSIKTEQTLSKKLYQVKYVINAQMYGFPNDFLILGFTPCSRSVWHYDIGIVAPSKLNLYANCVLTVH